MNVLKTENLKKYYGSGDSLVKALDGVDLSVERGEFVAVVGTSGSGKSTLLNMMGGLDNPTSGSVKIDGREISGMSRRADGFPPQADRLCFSELQPCANA